MDISDTDHVVLFDVLDADGSGNLSVAETVQGLVQVLTIITHKLDPDYLEKRFEHL